MERIRLGNNIAISWALYDLNGRVHSLEDKDIQLYMSCGGLKQAVTDYTIQGNVVSWVFLGTEQKKVGLYKLIIVERDELSGAQAVDVAEAFRIVSETLSAVETGEVTKNVSVRSVLTYSNLVGVESVDVVESSEDGGTNLVSIRLVDGNVVEVPIKNGTKGLKGDKGDKGDTGAKGDKGDVGERGPAGIDSVEAAIGTNDPTQAPSVDKDLNEGVLSLTFNNIKGRKGDKGDQGNTGSSVDYPYELVNNVTTDDATKGLSAAQGVALVSRISNGSPQVIVLVNGEYVDTGGAFATYAGWSRTDYLYIKGLDFLEYSGAGTSSQYNCFYDIEKHLLASFTIPSGSGQVAIPFGAAYCALSNTTSAMEGLTITNLPALPGIDAIQKEMVSSSAKIMQSSIVDSNNDGYYITPFIPFGGGNIVWHPSEVNTKVYLRVYDSSFEQVNQWTANAESITKNNLSSSYAYVRVEFAKNTRVGYLQLNKVIRWDNRTFDYYHYKLTSTYLQRANRLLDGYMYVGIIPNAAATPIIPVIPCYYIAFNSTYTNFLDGDGNPIVVPYDGELYIIKSVFSGDSFSHWSKEAMNIPILSFQRVYDNIGYRYIGKATPNTTPGTPKLPVFYFAQETGVYNDFQSSAGTPIVISDSGKITIIRSVFISQEFAYWTTEMLDIASPKEDIESAVIAYFEEHPASANQYVDFSNGADAYAVLGPSQDGADTRLCIAVGIANMRNNTGEKNMALGIENMSNAEGDGNTAIGYHSLFRLTSGENNVGCGNEALDDNIEGSRNTGLGWGAAKRNTNGNDNVSLGYCASHGDYSDGAYQSRPTFHRNTAVGSNAMRYIKTGSNDNVAIGYNATPNPEASNQIVIGSGARGEKQNQAVIGGMNVNDFVLGDKRLIFNNDGTVSWIQLFAVNFLYTRTHLTIQPPFVNKNSSFQTTVVLDDGYTELAVATITMGGVDITATAFNTETKEINIPNVTGNVVITMRAQV